MPRALLALGVLLALSGCGGKTSSAPSGPDPVSPVILAPAYLTRGTSRLVAVDASRDGHVYAWTASGGTFAGGGTTAEGPVVRVYPGALSAQLVLTCVASTARGAAPAATATVTVVEPPAVASFTALEDEVPAGEPARLDPRFSGGAGVVAWGDASAPVTSAVVFTSPPLEEDTEFTLTVTNLAGDVAERSVTVRVAP